MYKIDQSTSFTADQHNMPSPRKIAISDIHGCSIALESLLKLIDPKPDDTIICLGDFVDRGLDSKGVLDLLIELSDRCNLVPILGNHDEMMLKARDDESGFVIWTSCGGYSALASYGDSDKLDQIPDSHFEFLESCVSLFETDTHFFVHASYKPNTPFERQDRLTLRWESISENLPGPHFSGKIAVVGHTPQSAILDIGHLICLDTGCGFDGLLTAMDVHSRQVWQVDERGQRQVV